MVGKKTWVIPEGYIPKKSTGPAPEMTSHETACIINTGDKPVHINLIIYFTDADPVGPYKIEIPAKRIKHLRFNELVDPAPVPKGVEYASVFESDQPIVVQHTRLDTRQAANALLSTIAYGE